MATHNYPYSLDYLDPVCVWVIRGPEDLSITFDIDEISLGSICAGKSKSKLQLFAGSVEQGHVMLTLDRCLGWSLSDLISRKYSSSNIMTVVFRKTEFPPIGDNYERGFQATVSTSKLSISNDQT